MTSDNRPPLGSAGRRDRRPPLLDLSASDFSGWRRAFDWLPPDFPWSRAVAGAAGVLLLLLLIVALWPRRDGGMNVLDARITRAEQAVRDLAVRPPPPTVDPKAFEDLTGRLARLEAAVAAPRPPVSDPALLNRLAALEADYRSASERLGLLARRNDELSVIAGDVRQRNDANAAALAEFAQRVARIAPPAIAREEVDALANRIATLEGELRGRGIGETADRALRLAVVAAVLRAAVERGDPFAAELKAAQSLVADAAALAPLEAFARSGTPAAAVLARELLALAPSLLQGPATPARDGGFLERLQASAEKMVRIRPVDEMPGDDPAAVVARIEIRAAQADLAGALTELAKLPASLRAPAQAWIVKAQARNAAVELSRRFAADAVAALGKPSP
jgi:hypothetical protein